MRYPKMGAAMLALFLLNACAVFSNPSAPEKASATPPAGSGTVVISTGAAERCFTATTELFVAPAGSAYFSNVATGLNVDNYSVKSDFEDHQGFIDVLTLPAGSYEIYPFVLNAYIQPIKVSAIEFSVKPGEAVYVGEYFMDVACTLHDWVALRDREDRDLNLVRERNPAFAHVEFTKRLAHFSRYILDRTAE